MLKNIDRLKVTARGLFLFSGRRLSVLGSGEKWINRKAAGRRGDSPDQAGLTGVAAGGWASILRPGFAGGLGRSRARVCQLTGKTRIAGL
jgi:hypothetical protein